MTAAAGAMTSSTLHVGTRIRDSGKLVTMRVPDFRPSPKFAELIGAITDVINSDEFVYCEHVLSTREWAFPVSQPGAFCPVCAYRMSGWRRGESGCMLCGDADAGHVMLEIGLRLLGGTAGSVVLLGNMCRDCIAKETGLFATW